MQRGHPVRKTLLSRFLDFSQSASLSFPDGHMDRISGKCRLDRIFLVKVMAGTRGRRFGPPVKVSDWKAREYSELNNNGRLFYDAFYKLATMTFGWNASLAAAIILTSSNEKSLPPGILTIVGLGIPISAIVFNLGSFFTVALISNALERVRTSMQGLKLPEFVETPKHLEALLGQGNSVGKLTGIFYMLLVLIWFLVFVLAAWSFFISNSPVTFVLPFTPG